MSENVQNIEIYLTEQVKAEFVEEAVREKLGDDAIHHLRIGTRTDYPVADEEWGEREPLLRAGIYVSEYFVSPNPRTLIPDGSKPLGPELEDIEGVENYAPTHSG